MNERSASKPVSLSPGNITDQLQILLNKTAEAANYELEKRTVTGLSLIHI